MIDWGEGSAVTYHYPAGTKAFSEQHRYLDDNPTGTPRDDYRIRVTVRDDDGGIGNGQTTATVENADPVVLIDHVTDETGAEVGSDRRVVLRWLEIDLDGSFTDLGTRDSHTASINWGDGTRDALGASVSTASGRHAYREPGIYTATLSVTDDDTGTGIANRSVTVLDGRGALQLVIDDLRARASSPGLSDKAKDSLNKAVANLSGANGGLADNGALAQLSKSNRDPALGAIERTIQYLEQYEAITGTDLSGTKSLLSLTAKSITIESVQMAEAVATAPTEQRKITDARGLLAEGDRRLAERAYVDSVDTYQRAVVTILGLLP